MGRKETASSILPNTALTFDASLFFDGPLMTVEDTREDYGEPRYNALGLPVASCYRLGIPSAAMRFD